MTVIYRPRGLNFKTQEVTQNIQKVFENDKLNMTEELDAMQIRSTICIIALPYLAIIQYYYN